MLSSASPPPAPGAQCPHGPPPLPAAGQFVVRNLIPATIGNWIGGAIMMGGVYCLAYGKSGAAWLTAWERLVAKTKALLGAVPGSPRAHLHA
jgi:hypothetical protein